MLVVRVRIAVLFRRFVFVPHPTYHGAKARSPCAVLEETSRLPRPFLPPALAGLSHYPVRPPVADWRGRKFVWHGRRLTKQKRLMSFHPLGSAADSHPLTAAPTDLPFHNDEDDDDWTPPALPGETRILPSSSSGACTTSGRSGGRNGGGSAPFDPLRGNTGRGGGGGSAGGGDGFGNSGGAAAEEESYRRAVNRNNNNDDSSRNYGAAGGGQKERGRGQGTSGGGVMGRAATALGGGEKSCYSM